MSRYFQAQIKISVVPLQPSGESWEIEVTDRMAGNLEKFSELIEAVLDKNAMIVSSAMDIVRDTGEATI